MGMGAGLGSPSAPGMKPSQSTYRRRCQDSRWVGNFMHYISRFISGFATGFIKVRQISLVTLSILPLIALAGGIYAYVATDLIAGVRKYQSKSRRNCRRVYQRKWCGRGYCTYEKC
ncbi:unnamed protein product [Fraxinus pennsylvanica]|uniref:Uncharacterized protein n=1 Tax=Fraxinus pennsylvanica TaxID=56036 RepID=A0AAD2DIN3_9LAMI|nr:unnamed protein product [Fraxinus pennsylvanica]